MDFDKNNIKTFVERPCEVQLAFICVYHKQILEFMKTYGGVVYDFKKLNPSI